jgi:hypothetical protein
MTINKGVRIDQDWTGGEKKKLANNYFSIF